MEIARGLQTLWLREFTGINLVFRSAGVRAIAGNNEVYPGQTAGRDTVRFGVWRRTGEESLLSSDSPLVTTV